MKIIDGRENVLGRIASFAAKEALKGEEIAIINCDQIIITGNVQNIREEFQEKRRRVGSGQLGPKVSRDIVKMVKRTIRGMLPNVRHGGRGKDAFRKIKCYKGIPSEFVGKKFISFEKKNISKSASIREIGR